MDIVAQPKTCTGHFPEKCGILRDREMTGWIPSEPLLPLLGTSISLFVSGGSEH